MAHNFQRPRSFSLGQQVAGMEAMWPQFQRQHWSASQVIWKGYLQPLEICNNYCVLISYKLQESPNVHVVSPKLEARQNGTPIPHVYPGNRLCLYFPGLGEWHPTKMLSHTIVPWTSLWLYYYEVWHATGNWKGGGVMPGKRVATGCIK